MLLAFGRSRIIIRGEKDDFSGTVDTDENGRRAVPAGAGRAESSFSLAAGEAVTINAVYSPADASVDFGLISPGGLFHPLPGSDGAFKATIEVPTRGKYTLAVRNNSQVEVSVASGRQSSG